jgi:hypothetical protein
MVNISEEELAELILIYELEALGYGDKKALEWVRQLRSKYNIEE